MATSIVPPSMVSPQFQLPGQSIDQTFGGIYNMMGGRSSGMGPGGSANLFGQPISGGMATSGGYGMPINQTPQPDQVMTSVFNLLGQAGPSLLQQGGNLINQGMSTIQPAANFNLGLASGNPLLTSMMLGPEASNLSQLYSGALGNMSESLPQGAFRSAEMQNVPFAQAAQLGNAALGLIPTALNNLLGIGSQEASLGTTLTGQGLNTLNNLQQGILNKQQLNYSQPSALAQALGGISTIFGGAAAAGAGGD